MRDIFGFGEDRRTYKEKEEDEQSKAKDRKDEEDRLIAKSKSKEQEIEFKKTRDYLNSEEWQQYLGDFMEKFLNTKKGKEIINRHIENRENKIMNDNKKKDDDLKREYEEKARRDSFFRSNWEVGI